MRLGSEQFFKAVYPSKEIIKLEHLKGDWNVLGLYMFWERNESHIPGSLKTVRLPVFQNSAPGVWHLLCGQ